MNVELELSHILQAGHVGHLPLICQTLRQKWAHAHYVHGKNAYVAGGIAAIPERTCLQVAAATEIVWAAILILDDIIDGDEVRYHAPSAWKAAGYPTATGEMTRALLEGVLLVDAGPVRDALLRACADTVSAMQQIARLSPCAPLSEIETHFRALGALSSFAVAWPWTDPGMRQIAELETCAGQLVNDCNDCFGAKAVRRGYPDIRNRQASLLMGIVQEHYGRHDLAKLVADASTDQCAEIARAVFDVVHGKPEIIIRTFDRWMNAASSLAQSLPPGPVQDWTLTRVRQNWQSWEKKLEGLLTGCSP